MKDIFIPFMGKGCIEIKEGKLTLRGDGGFQCCPTANVEEYQLNYCKKGITGTYTLVINNPHMDSAKTFIITKLNSHYNEADELCKILKENAAYNKMGYVKAICMRTSEQIALDNKIAQKNKEATQKQKEINAEQRAIKEQRQLVKAELQYYHSQAKCPKCRSTSISHGNKKLSIGRALAGGAVAGSAGAVLGGLTSKKSYAVCMNCGKRWKI